MRSQLPLLVQLLRLSHVYSDLTAAAVASLHDPDAHPWNAQQQAMAHEVKQAAAHAAWATHAHIQHGLAASSRSPVHFAPHQQLCWVLEVVGADAGALAAGFRPSQGPTQPAAANAGAAAARKQPASRDPLLASHLRHYLASAVLPALVSEMWGGWHEALWNCSAAQGTILHGSPRGVKSAAAGVQAGRGHGCKPAGPARLMHTASAACAAAAVALDIVSEVQTRAVRLQQLRLAARHMLSSAPPTQRQSTEEWQPLAALLAHTLWAHVSSLPEEAGKHLHSLLARLWAACSVGACTQGAEGSILDAAWAAELCQLLLPSNHSVLLAQVNTLVHPLALTIAQGLQKAAQPWSSASRAAERQAGQGACWAMLGLLRLHLAAPPPGIDPAGKHLLKANHIKVRGPHHPDACFHLCLFLERGHSSVRHFSRL